MVKEKYIFYSTLFPPKFLFPLSRYFSALLSLLCSVSPSALSSLQTQTAYSSQHQHQHHTPCGFAEAQPIHPHPSPLPTLHTASHLRPISKSLYRFTLTLNRFNQTHLQIPLPIHPHPHSSHKPNTLDSTHLTLHSITLSSNRYSRFN